LDKASELQGKHTIFGKVTGDTIFNVLKLNDFEVDSQERPIYPPLITGVDIISNPFEDIKPRKTIEKKPEKNEKTKSKAKKNFNLLSFGEVAEQEETEFAKTEISMKSSLHWSDNPISKKTAEEVEKLKNEKRKREDEPEKTEEQRREEETQNVIKKTKKCKKESAKENKTRRRTRKGGNRANRREGKTSRKNEEYS